MLGRMVVSSRGSRGFTIVELLIVVIVIAVLAAISVAAYNGIQERARFSSYRSDITAINKAVLLYNSVNGRYPGNVTTGCWTNTPSGTGNFITGLVPTYIAKIPDTLNGASGQNYYAYCWTANSADYKLIRLVPSGQTVPSVESSGGVDMDPSRPGRGWGIWSPGGATL